MAKTSPIYVLKSSPLGFVLLANGQFIKTPAGNELVLPTEAIAKAVQEEWQAQGDKIKPETMPMTQLAMTALDIVAMKRAASLASTIAIGSNDMLCQRADEPTDLVIKQTTLWDPWLEWAQDNLGVIMFIGHGIMPVNQSDETLGKLQNILNGYDCYALAGLQQAASLMSSLILGLALAKGAASADNLFAVAELESIYQAEKWGIDPVTAERHKSLRKELGDCVRWFSLIG